MVFRLMPGFADLIDHRLNVLDDLGLDQPGSLAAHRRCELLMELLRGRRAAGRHAVSRGYLDPVERRIVEIQHRQVFCVGFALAHPGQFDIQNCVVIILEQDDGDIGLLPCYRPERLDCIHPTPIAFDSDNLTIRSRHRGSQRHRESGADGGAT
jgi:hypothetical protein